MASALPPGMKRCELHNRQFALWSACWDCCRDAELVNARWDPATGKRESTEAQQLNNAEVVYGSHKAPACEQCGLLPVAYPGARFCGAACTAEYESKLRTTCLGCGSADCVGASEGVTACPDRIVDGLTVRECLERYERLQRMDRHTGIGWCYRTPEELYPLTVAQHLAAQSAWSSALRAKQQETRQKERERVVCDEQWGEEL
jgi:hypothetical protein